MFWTPTDKTSKRCQKGAEWGLLAVLAPFVSGGAGIFEISTHGRFRQLSGQSARITLVRICVVCAAFPSGQCLLGNLLRWVDFFSLAYGLQKLSQLKSWSAHVDFTRNHPHSYGCVILEPRTFSDAIPAGARNANVSKAEPAHLIRDSGV